MSTDLAMKRCKPYIKGALPLTLKEIKDYNQQLSKPWQVTDNTELIKEFNFNNFQQSIDFVNKIASIAEQEHHHPDIAISYSKVLLKFQTHSINGLSENDYIMAEKINKLS